MTAQQLRAMLDAKQVSQAELARRLIVNKQTVNRWCQGTSGINKRNAEAIRKALK